MKKITFLLILVLLLSSCRYILLFQQKQYTTSSLDSVHQNNTFLFFLAKEPGKELMQIFSLSLLDYSVKQITYSSLGIVNFDVSISTGNISFIDNARSLILFSKFSSSETVISEGVARFPPPSWSIDGKMIAFSKNGIFNYFVDTKESYPIKINSTSTLRYCHYSFSPDGSMLVIGTPTYSIYNVASHTYTPLEEIKEYPSSLEASIYWASDSSHFYIAETRLVGTPFGIIYPGLWRYDITGKGESMLPYIEADEFNLDDLYKAMAPWEDITNGYVYFLLSTGVTDHKTTLYPYYLVRMELADKSNIEYIYDNPFYISSSTHVVWDKDGQFIIMAQRDCYHSTPSLILVPMDTTKPIITLLKDAEVIQGNLRLSQ